MLTGCFSSSYKELDNVGPESFDTTDGRLRAGDERDRRFEVDLEASAYADSDPGINVEGITYEQLNPGLQVTGAVVFDVNQGSEYRLKIAPVGVFSAADAHIVTLGEVPTPS